VTTLTAERHDSILLLRLASPDSYPRLTRPAWQSLGEQLTRGARDEAIRAIVLTGTDQAFAAGAELKEVSTLTALEALRFSAMAQGWMSRIERSPKPVVAAICGWCLGGGLDLALACHLRLAATDAQFGHPGGVLGLVTGWGGTARLPRLVGWPRALELLTTGRTISATEAHAWHLVSEVLEPHALLDRAVARARQIADLMDAGR